MSNTDATPNQKIARDAELVTSHEDLADCINKLLDAYNRGLFEEQGVIDYLEGMEGVSGGLVSALAATSNGPGSVGAGVASAVMYARAEAACLTLLSAR